LILTTAASTYSGWAVWKSAHNLSNSVGSSDATILDRFNEFNSYGLEEKLLAIPSTISALNGFGVEFYGGEVRRVGGEARLFGIPALMPSEKCGRYFPGPEEYLAVSTLVIPAYCVGEVPLAFIESLSPMLSFLLPVLSFIGFALLLSYSYSQIRCKNYLIVLALLSPQISIFAYTIANGAISRYGVAPIALNLGVALIVARQKLPSFGGINLRSLGRRFRFTKN
jgi:hypothetical protein